MGSGQWQMRTCFRFKTSRPRKWQKIIELMCFLRVICWLHYHLEVFVSIVLQQPTFLLSYTVTDVQLPFSVTALRPSSWTFPTETLFFLSSLILTLGFFLFLFPDSCLKLLTFLWDCLTSRFPLFSPSVNPLLTLLNLLCLRRLTPLHYQYSIEALPLKDGTHLRLSKKVQRFPNNCTISLWLPLTVNLVQKHFG